MVMVVRIKNGVKKAVCLFQEIIQELINFASAREGGRNETQDC